LIVEYQTLSLEALSGIAQQFVLSQLSEVEDEIKMTDWISQAIDKVKSGELLVEYSEIDNTVTLKHHSEINMMSELNDQ